MSYLSGHYKRFMTTGDGMVTSSSVRYNYIFTLRRHLSFGQTSTSSLLYCTADVNGACFLKSQADLWR